MPKSNYQEKESLRFFVSCIKLLMSETKKNPAKLKFPNKVDDTKEYVCFLKLYKNRVLYLCVCPSVIYR